MRPTWGLQYWPFFLIAVSLMFLIPELIALFSNTVNTLSDFSWFELGVNARVGMRHPAWYLSLAAWALFVIVITGHIWFRSPG